MNTNVQARPGTQVTSTPAPITDIDDVELKTDTRPAIRLGFWVLVVGFGLFLAWAAWAPLDEGVSSQATVSVESRRKTIQHMQGGVIRDLLVKEGAEVKLGDVLVVLDDAATRAGFESVRQSYLSQRAQESRLLAEVIGAPSITFHRDLLVKGDTVSALHMSVQQQLFASRRAAQAAELSAAQQSIVGMEGQVAGTKQMLESKHSQQALQARQLAGVKSLADDGFAPRNQALQLEQNQAEMRSAIADLETTQQRVLSAIAETRLKIAQRQQEYIKEVSSQLADVRKDVQANEERLTAITAELGRTQIKAPVGGQVIGLAVSGVGGVVTPGQRLMDILPRGEIAAARCKDPAERDRSHQGGRPGRCPIHHLRQFAAVGGSRQAGVTVGRRREREPRQRGAQLLPRPGRDHTRRDQGAGHARGATGHDGRGAGQDRRALAAHLPDASVAQAGGLRDEGRVIMYKHLGRPMARPLRDVMLAVSGCLAMALGAHAMTMQEAFQAAVRNDAQYRAAGHELASAQFAVPAARAALLPQISLNASGSDVVGSRSFPNAAAQDVTVRVDYAAPQASWHCACRSSTTRP
ncbi:MAG: HlyD family type I secretion periplasmic adaptor subunit [Ideonella sp.]|nr:HlyD family type I secretion periplasmic adaptor subunit [Ideonella sp.]